jgi:glucose-6-phosphate isomerase
MNADGRTRLNQTPEWTALARHREELGEVRLRELFAADPGRGAGYTLQVGDLHIDYSKHLVTDETLTLLRRLAAATEVFGLRDAMFRGEKINITEGRAVLQTALRAPRDAVIEVDGENVVPAVPAVLGGVAAHVYGLNGPALMAAALFALAVTALIPAGRADVPVVAPDDDATTAPVPR